MRPLIVTLPVAVVRAVFTTTKRVEQRLKLCGGEHAEKVIAAQAVEAGLAVALQVEVVMSPLWAPVTLVPSQVTVLALVST